MRPPSYELSICSYKKSFSATRKKLLKISLAHNSFKNSLKATQNGFFGISITSTIYKTNLQAKIVHQHGIMQYNLFGK